MAIFYPPNAAHFDANQVPTMMGVEGTLGTADVSGTAAPLPIGVDPATGAVYVNNIGAAGGGGTTVTVDHGTVTSIGTILGIGGTVQVSGASAGTNVNVVTGTINSATVVLNSGTISSLPNTPGGTINLATVTGNLGTAGTVGLINTVTTVTTVSNLTNGSIKVTTGTVNAGTINTGTINTGTINTGTINAGTINAGTIQLNPLPATNTISHAGTSGTTGIGTLVGTASIGSGTAAYITAYHILVISGTPEVTLAFGSVTNGNQVIAHGLFPAGGGITETIPYPHGYGTTNSPITYQINSGAGTVEWSVDYFTHT